MKNWIIVFLLTSAGAWAQPALAPPRLGFVEDSAPSLRPVYGLAGNFILGSAITGKMVAGNIVTEAFFGSFGLVKTGTSLSAFDAEGKLLASMNVSPGPALFAFSPGGSTALAYVASSNALVEWQGDKFVPVSWNPEAISGAVLVIAFPTAAEASLIVQRSDTLWELNLALSTGGIISQKALTGIRAPLLLLPSGDIGYRATGGIEIRRTDASEVRISASLPASFSLQQMNQEWVELTDLNSKSRFAIRTTVGRESFYQLPE